jgi:hypothetical protein
MYSRRINNGVMQPVSRQRIGKHFLAATNTHTTIDLLLETVFSTRSMQNDYKGNSWDHLVSCQSVESQPVKRRLGERFVSNGLNLTVIT